MQRLHEAAASSYDRITVARKGEQMASKKEDIVLYRNFNNYVKKLLIVKATEVAFRTAQKDRGFRVLDLASGRGGDQAKWLFVHNFSPAKPPPMHSYLEAYVGVDLSAECVAEAIARYDQSPRPEHLKVYDVKQGNCFSAEYWQETAQRYALYFDVVSVQFAFHYGATSREVIDVILKGVSAVLRPGGVFIGTIVDAAELNRRASEGRELASRLFSVTFLPPPSDHASLSKAPPLPLTLGTPYHFYLEGHVDCVEYVLPIEDIIAAGATVSLVPESSISERHHRFATLLEAYEMDLKAMNAVGGRKLDADERALVTLYRTFCFVKT